MSIYIPRKKFLSLSLVGTVGLLVGKSIPAVAQQQKPDPLDKELVKEFVIKGHGDLPGVKAMLEKTPGLLNACWDWGGGDFETAIEGAGHVGNRAVAEFLLEKGARMNVFCAAMLGRIDIVKSVLAINPDLKNSKGPHGLQLIHHATKGGEQAKAVLEYLKEIGAA